MDLAKLIVNSDGFESLKIQVNAELKKEAEIKVEPVVKKKGKVVKK